MSQWTSSTRHASVGNSMTNASRRSKRCMRVGRAARMAVSIIGLSCLIAGCSRDASPGSDSQVVRPVKSMIVAAGGDTRMRSFPGKVEASQQVELAFQVPGLLVKLPIKEGQHVAQGELLAQLRLDEYQARLSTLRGQLDQAQAVLASLRLGERPEERLRRESQVRSAE